MVSRTTIGSGQGACCIGDGHQSGLLFIHAFSGRSCGTHSVWMQQFDFYRQYLVAHFPYMTESMITYDSVKDLAPTDCLPSRTDQFKLLHNLAVIARSTETQASPLYIYSLVLLAVARRPL